MTAPTHSHTLPAQPAESTRATDEDLVAALGRGDESALRTLHHRYAPLVFTVAARHVDTATAEEVVQDVFLTLWRRHDTFDPARGAFKGWIAQIARRRALNELRRKHGRREQGEESLDQLSGDALEPDEAQWLAHRQTVIRAAVDALPPAQRQALSLAFFDELTHEQIASVLRTPLGTTKTRIRLALRRLAPLLLAVLAAAIVVLVARRREERSSRNERALRMVTASDVVPLHLAAAAGVPEGAHGSYRTRPGAGIAVLTTSHLPPLAGGEEYSAWIRRAEGWRLLGPVVVESDGRSLLVSEMDPRSAPPDEIRVTRESGPPAEAPRGVAVVAWVAPSTR